MRVAVPQFDDCKTPADSLANILDQSQRVKTLVEECAEDLVGVKWALTQELATATPTLRVAAALEKSNALENKVQDVSAKLAMVNKALIEEVQERHVMEDRLAALTEQSETARHAAFHDSLTGLPNRALFNNRLEHGLAQAHRHGWTLAVMFVDLNNFKRINDQYGHEAGDSVLQEISNRLRRITRRDDTICRHGGDEFLYLLPDIETEKDAITIAKKLIAAIQEPCEIAMNDSRVTVVVGASIGIAISSRHGLGAEDLVRHADAAMYEAKRSNSGQSLSSPLA